ncbi:MAG: SPOR domain-containing protein [Bacteroidetes bacterium]|nr:SPOR domain-containing protein [Bacteroidota bacterium]
MRLIILLFLAMPCFSQAQKLDNDSLAFILTQRHKKVNASKMTMPGYRIQIYFGNERIKAQEIKSIFLQNHSKISAYMVYHQPNFKVRVGDFRTRLEAVGFLKKIESEFKTSFIVPDDVKLPEL